MPIHELFVYLRAKDAESAIAFYTDVFDAKESFRLTEPNGRIGHAELLIGDTTVMISDEFPEYGIHAPDPSAPTTFTMHLHVDDADALIDKAVEAGATLERTPQDHFYGERSGTVRDPFGTVWLIGHAIEDVTPEEMQRRYTEMLAAGQ